MIRQFYQVFSNWNAVRSETQKNHTIVKYSVLNESKQLFASKYMLYLPSEEELRKELERERHLIEMEKHSNK